MSWTFKRATTRRKLVAETGSSAVRTALASGQLQQIWRGVVVRAADAGDVRTRAAAAIQAVGSHAVVSGPTALELHGCTAAASSNVHVTVPYTSWPRSRKGLRVHQNRFTLSHVIELDNLPVFDLVPAIADFLCDGPKWTSLACLDQVLAGLSPGHDRDVRERIRQYVDARDDPRGKANAMFLTDLATGLADSPPESWFRLIVIQAGLPLPEAQFPIHAANGDVRYRLDMAWPEFHMALEYDGYAAHEDRADRDAARDADLARRGWVVVRAQAADLKDPSRVLRDLTAAMMRR